jgi:seryl-tRNA synthetase
MTKFNDKELNKNQVYAFRTKSLAEVEYLERAINFSQVSKSEFIRRCTINAPIKSPIMERDLAEKYIQELRKMNNAMVELTRELNQQGDNLNQLTKAAHIAVKNGHLRPSKANEFISEIKSMRNDIGEIASRKNEFVRLYSKDYLKVSKELHRRGDVNADN